MTNTMQKINIVPTFIYPADEELVHPLQVELKKNLTGMGRGITELLDPPTLRRHFITRYMVAMHDGYPIGAATIRIINKSCELYKLYVSPTVQRNQVGTLLVAQVMAEMRALGMEEMKVEAQESSREFWGKMISIHPFDQEVSCFSNIIFRL